MVKITSLNGSIILDNGAYRAAVVPQAGGKVKSFYSVATGREFLYQDEREVIPDEGYESFDHSGWDECFPNIRPCDYPVEPFQGVALPDHGFLWSQPNSWQLIEDGVMLSAKLPMFRLNLTRLYKLNDCGLTVQYWLHNEGGAPFVYLTDAHILFSWEPGLRVELPPEAGNLYVYRSSDADKVLPGTWVPQQFWNEVAEGYNCKVFTQQLRKGEIVLHYEQKVALPREQSNMEESIRILFDPEKLPYAGLWIANEFRDAQGNRTHCFSVQPTNMASATLPPLEWAGNCRTVMPGITKVWDVTLEVSLKRRK